MGQPGLSQRALVSRDEAALRMLVRQCLVADGGLPDAASESFIRRQYLAGPGAGWFANGVLVAAAALGAERDGRVTASGAVSPGFRGRGLGRRLFGWTVAAPGGTPLLITAESVGESAMRLYARLGLREVFAELVMSADVAELSQATRPAATLPPGLALKAWTADLAPAFFAAYDGAFRDRPGFPGWSERDWLSRTMQDDGFAPALCRLAADEAGDPVGFLIVSVNWIAQMGVVPRWRHHGLGNALLAAAMSGIASAGFRTCWLTVATNNPAATRLYRSAGFAEVGRRARYELG
ncbi:MAG TPA: GNAT family N-acetyltransferase [Streptosporangiaceae bacterium]